jgi:hypothetical protein
VGLNLTDSGVVSARCLTEVDNGDDRRYLGEHSMRLLNDDPEEVTIPELTAVWPQSTELAR